jgi:hypothetical protein
MRDFLGCKLELLERDEVEAVRSLSWGAMIESLNWNDDR